MNWIYERMEGMKLNNTQISGLGFGEDQIEVWLNLPNLHVKTGLFLQMNGVGIQNSDDNDNIIIIIEKEIIFKNSEWGGRK